MKKKLNVLLYLTLLIFYLSVFTPYAHAIIVLPPLILFSLINLLGGITAVMALPTLIISGLTTYILKPKNRKEFIIHTIILTVILLVIFMALGWVLQVTLFKTR